MKPRRKRLLRAAPKSGWREDVIRDRRVRFDITIRVDSGGPIRERMLREHGRIGITGHDDVDLRIEPDDEEIIVVIDAVIRLRRSANRERLGLLDLEAPLTRS